SFPEPHGLVAREAPEKRPHRPYPVDLPPRREHPLRRLALRLRPTSPLRHRPLLGNRDRWAEPGAASVPGTSHAILRATCAATHRRRCRTVREVTGPYGLVRGGDGRPPVVTAPASASMTRASFDTTATSDAREIPRARR